MPPLINAQRELFCLAYFQGKSAREASAEAGYSPKTAKSTGSRLLTFVDVQARLRELQEAAQTAKIMGVRERKERLSEIARARLSDFVSAGPDGSWINIGIESMNSAALQEVKSRTEYNKDSDTPAVIIDIKLHDPVKAINELNKMEGAYAPAKQELSGTLSLKVPPKSLAEYTEQDISELMGFWSALAKAVKKGDITLNEAARKLLAPVENAEPW